MRVNKILAIAITEYEDAELNKIENCKDDISGILSVISEKYAFDDIEFIYTQADTARKNLYFKLTDYFSNTLPEDNVLLLFAGHGQYNESLEMAYWQPSDADPNDPSSWININDILAFIKATKALHVSIISDSCFAGAIFEHPKRGGGIEALTTKKSREALTSGGIEKVSDGKKGDKSPFALTLINVLKENEKSLLPFNVFSNNVILQFDAFKKQTPMAGSLNGVGHEGGTFIFELKKLEKNNEQIDNPNNYLKKKLGNLFIPIPENILNDASEINRIRKEKNEVVKKQRFEEAVRLRDSERSLEEKIKKETIEYIDSFGLDIKFGEQEIAETKQLDIDIEKFSQSVAEQRELYDDAINKYEKEKGTSTSEKKEPTTLITGTTLMDLQYSHIDFLFSKEDNPASKYLKKNQSSFIQKYQENVISLYKYFKFIQGISVNSIMIEKANVLKDILLKTLKYEIDILSGKVYEFVDETLQMKEIEISFLNWINNKD